MLWTWANALTLLRALLIAPMVFCMLEGWWWAAATLFVVAALTDYFDGPLARRSGQASALGGIADHGIDAVFVTAVCTAAALLGQINPLLPVLIMAAFIQYLLDSRALAGRPLRASQLGRYNGIAYYVIAGAVTIAPAIGLWTTLAPVVAALAWVLVASTVLSMANRLQALLRGSGP